MRLTLVTIVSTFSISALTTLPSLAFAQRAGLTTPEQSPAAVDSQMVGITEIKVSYHRPAVAGRKVWGELVPYGEVWRMGANENTTISFSTPVKLAGQPLPAGTYGLHAIPSASTWTVIVSTMASAWGSYGYTQKEDAYRFTTTPVVGDFTERLAYRFDDPTDAGVTLSMHWDKVVLPIKIEVDTPAAVMASMRLELRGGQQFNSAAWNQAANYWLEHGGALSEAESMAQHAVNMQSTYQTLSTLALVADKKGDKKTAEAKRKEADPLASEADLNIVGYTLLSQHKNEESLAVFQKNAQRHPASWNVYDSLADAYLAKGDTKAAVDSYGKALKLVKDDANRTRIEATIARLKAKKT